MMEKDKIVTVRTGEGRLLKVSKRRLEACLPYRKHLIEAMTKRGYGEAAKALTLEIVKEE